MKSATALLPASSFSVVMALAAWGNTWRLATRLWGLPVWIGEVILCVAALIWVMLLILYAGKWTWHRTLVKTEFHHPTVNGFVALVPVSGMLIAVAILPYSRSTAMGLFWLSFSPWLVFALWHLGDHMCGENEPLEVTHILFLPLIAGNFVATTAAAAFGWSQWAQILFGAGVLVWFSLESVLLHRLLTQNALPSSLRPTLGIQLAPPAVGLMAYLGVTSGPPTLAAHGLLGYALLQALLFARLWPWVRQPAFSTGYWAFGFGLCGLGLGTQTMAERAVDGPANMLAPALFLLCNTVMLSLSIGSSRMLIRWHRT